MRNFVLSIFAILLLCAQTAVAQNVRVSGTVTSSADNAPIAGATVMVKGSTNGVVTDVNGKYSINVPTKSDLVFAFMGMATQTVPVDSRTVINVNLMQDHLNIDEVVVTALGISRAEKTLGYAVSTVKAEELTKARESNVVNSLAGKVAGVNVIASSGTPGGSSKIILRGQSSLGSSGQPIFVIDGMPVSNSSFNPAGIQGNVDAGSRVGDLSSDDIESMSVLKGAAATALYGARAKDGAVIITTKKGSKNTQTFVTVNTSFRMDNVLKLPEFQNDYAQGNGTDGTYSYGAQNGWGPRIDAAPEKNFKNFLGKEAPLKAYKNNVKDFYETGKTYINSISIGGGDQKNDYRIGVTAYNQSGVIPSNDYNKYNFTFNGGRDFSDKVSARVSFSYVKSNSTGRTAQGSNDVNILVPQINSIPRTTDINWLKNNWINDEPSDVNYGKPITVDEKGKTSNLYWTINKNKFTNDVDRIMGNVVITYKPVKGITITNNAGTDYFNETRRQVYANYTIGADKGKFSTYDITGRIINNDLIASYDKQFGKDFAFKALIGNNIYESQSKILGVNAESLLVPDLYSYANAEVKTPSNSYQIERLVGVYGEVSLTWKNMLSLSVTGRNDWSSTMPKSHQSYFYPSINSSFIFTEILPENKILEFGKLRLSYANVGSSANPYALDYSYSPVNTYFLQYLGSTSGHFPHGGLLGYTSPRTYPDPDLEPQNQSAFEVGLDLRFLRGRVRLDATYYYNKTTKNIAKIDVPPTTGYFAISKNAATLVNEGVEVMLGLTPVTTRNFNWDMNVTFASNKQKVTEINGVNEVQLTSGWSSLSVKAKKGEAFGIYGIKFRRDPEGNFIIDQKTGKRLVESSASYLGKINPDWTMGINNSFNYKGIGLSFLIDIRQGGVMYSSTVSNLRTSGQGKETLFNNRKPIVDKGTYLDEATGKYVENKKSITAYNYWSMNYTVGNTEANIFDASFVKLREVVLSYTIPGSLLKNFFIKNITVGVEGRNLWIIDSAVPHIDPEANFFGSSDPSYGVEFASVPSTRTFGFNLKFNF